MNTIEIFNQIGYWLAVLFVSLLVAALFAAFMHGQLQERKFGGPLGAGLGATVTETLGEVRGMHNARVSVYALAGDPVRTVGIQLRNNRGSIEVALSLEESAALANLLDSAADRLDAIAESSAP